MSSFDVTKTPRDEAPTQRISLRDCHYPHTVGIGYSGDTEEGARIGSEIAIKFTCHEHFEVFILPRDIAKAFAQGLLNILKESEH